MSTGVATEPLRGRTFRSTTILTSSDFPPRGYHSTCSSVYGGTETTPVEYAPMPPTESMDMEYAGHPAPRSERGRDKARQMSPAHTFRGSPILL